MEITFSSSDHLTILKHAMSAYSWPIVFLICAVVFAILAYLIPFRIRTDWPKSKKWLFGTLFIFASLMFIFPWMMATGSHYELNLDKQSDLIQIKSTSFLIYSSTKSFKLHELKNAEVQTDRSALRLALIFRDGDIEYPLSVVFDQRKGYYEIRDKINEFSK